ncbi:unnamed protein product, partial [Symbiodinium necroappetens]
VFCTLLQHAALLFKEQLTCRVALAQGLLDGRGNEMVERLGGNSSDEEYVDVLLDSGEEDEDEPRPLTGPPAGPPPPIATPLQAVQAVSYQVSQAMARSLGIVQGQVLTVMPPHWADLRRVTVEVRGMMPNEAMHPHVLHFSDSAPPGPAALSIMEGPSMPEGPAIPPAAPRVASPRPRQRPKSKAQALTKEAADTVLADLEIARMQADLDIDAELHNETSGDDTGADSEQARPGSSTDHLRPSASSSTRRSGTRRADGTLEAGDEEMVTVLLDEPQKPTPKPEQPGNDKPRPHLILQPQRDPLIAGYHLVAPSFSRPGAAAGSPSSDPGLGAVLSEQEGGLALPNTARTPSQTTMHTVDRGQQTSMCTDSSMTPSECEKNWQFADSSCTLACSRSCALSPLPRLARSIAALVIDQGIQESDLRCLDRKYIPGAATLKKRTLTRVINKAQADQSQTIKYKGQRYHLHDQRPGETSTPGPPRLLQQSRPARRLRVVSYNCGGLSASLYQELVAWLKAEETRGEPVDVLCIQETAWKEDFEFRTATNHPLEPQWHAIHAGGPARTGILCLIRSSLLRADQIRYVVLVPGRVLHVRLLFEIPLDLLLLYQVAWNPQKAELKGHKVDALVQQRAKLWHQVEQWLARIPLRNGTILIGDFNTPLCPEQGLCGEGVVSREGSQIDFLVVRGNLLDAKAPSGLWYHSAPNEAKVWQAAQNTLDTAATDEVPNIDAALLQGLAQLWTGWRRICALQQLQRELRRRGRHKKIHMVEQAVKADNVYQAAKQFAPKTARRRLQLRTEQGHLQTAAEEFRTIKQYYETLYAGPAPTRDFLCTRLDFQLEEVLNAIKNLAPGKAMPSYSAPAALWNNLHAELAPQVLQQLNHVFSPGLLVLPAEWCISELVLLPKPGKALTSPSHLRPIALLPPIAKVLASVLASRIQPFAAAYLENTPQFAYLRGRSLQQALERVISHCAETRALIAQQATNPHTRRSGREVLQIAGGLQLSLDVSQAYDGVSRSHLRDALLEAQIPEALTTAILATHNQAVLRISHDQYTDNIKLLTGLRQGCSLSPILWSIYTGWLLRRLEETGLVPVSQAGTVFADDAHFSWLIKTGSQLEAAYSGVRAVLNHLAAYNLKVSIDKTVILVELRGSKATALLKKYVIQKETGPHMRFKVGGEHMDIKIVSKHVYLGLHQKNGIEAVRADSVSNRSSDETLTFDPALAFSVGHTPTRELPEASRFLLPQIMAAPGLRGQLAEATEELRLIESLVPEGSQGFRKQDQPRRMQLDDPLAETANLEDDKDHPAKWRRPDNKGQGGRGKGHSSNQPDETYEPYWGEGWSQSWNPQRQGANRADAQLKELQNLRHRVDLLTTLVLRHDNALNILAQDQTYMIFVRTDIPGNLASILYEAGKAWNDLKASNPEKLEAPMRVILFQKFLVTVKARLEHILTSEDKLHQAQNLHWITEDGASLNAMKWDPEHNRHVVNKELPVVEITKAKSILEEMIILGRHPRSINRFHATRTMAETYASPTLTFKLDLGLRTTEAQSSTTRPAGPESCPVAEATAAQREQAQRVLRINILNSGNYCYANSLVKCLLMLECHHGWLDGTKLIPEPLQGILRGFMNARKPFALWDNPFWKTLVRDWRSPGIQHDVADFLMFLG